MRRLSIHLAVCCCAALPALPVRAQGTAAPTSQPSASGSAGAADARWAFRHEGTLDLVSVYRSRGISYGERPAVQLTPVTATTWRGTTLTGSAFGNVDLFLASASAVALAPGKRGLTELDLTLDVGHTVGPVDLGVGVVRYVYPNREGTTRDDDTQEVLVRASVADWAGASLAAYWDVGILHGIYLEGSVSPASLHCGRHEMPLTLTIGAVAHDHVTYRETAAVPLASAMGCSGGPGFDLRGIRR